MVLPIPKEKERAVQEMFASIAPRYDLNNTLLSFGLHHRWKRIAAEQAQLSQDSRVLDLCAGTGDLALILARKAGRRGRVTALDLNQQMLSLGRQKLHDARLKERVGCVVANAECLPFSECTFHTVTVAFGIRNVNDVKKALYEILKVLQPGGRMICLEFSVPKNALVRKLYDLYSFYWLPWIGSLVSGDKTGTYRYLPASIRTFPDQETLKQLLQDTGFTDVTYRNLTGGIVAIHMGAKPVA
jgi:demethylmenaquinone methyltransferase / 2-methoxy-6-polyprenyl-1,4-benzoquinol methylase